VLGSAHWSLIWRVDCLSSKLNICFGRVRIQSSVLSRYQLWLVLTSQIGHSINVFASWQFAPSTVKVVQEMKTLKSFRSRGLFLTGLCIAITDTTPWFRFFYATLSKDIVHSFLARSNVFKVSQATHTQQPSATWQQNKRTAAFYY